MLPRIRSSSLETRPVWGMRALVVLGAFASVGLGVACSSSSHPGSATPGGDTGGSDDTATAETSHEAGSEAGTETGDASSEAGDARFDTVIEVAAPDGAPPPFDAADSGTFACTAPVAFHSIWMKLDGATPTTLSTALNVYLADSGRHSFGLAYQNDPKSGDPLAAISALGAGAFAPGFSLSEWATVARSGSTLASTGPQSRAFLAFQSTPGATQLIPLEQLHFQVVAQAGCNEVKVTFTAIVPQSSYADTLSIDGKTTSIGVLLGVTTSVPDAGGWEFPPLPDVSLDSGLPPLGDGGLISADAATDASVAGVAIAGSFIAEPTSFTFDL